MVRIPVLGAALVAFATLGVGAAQAHTGPHGGPVAAFEANGKEIGHAEVLISKDGKQVIVYFLDETAKKTWKVAPEKITDLKLRFEKPNKTENIDLKYDKTMSGDKDLVFVGALPKEMKAEAKELAGKLSVTIEGTKFNNREFPE